MAFLGKRYRCDKCGAEALCTKAGEGIPKCCNAEMKTQEQRPIAPSD